jgi:hypothetical protein
MLKNSKFFQKYFIYPDKLRLEKLLLSRNKLLLNYQYKKISEKTKNDEKKELNIFKNDEKNQKSSNTILPSNNLVNNSTLYDEQKIQNLLNSPIGNFIKQGEIPDLIKYKVFEDSFTPTVEKLSKEIPEIENLLELRDYINKIIDEDKQHEALQKHGLIILQNKLDPFFKYKIDNHNFRKYHDREYEVDIEHEQTKDLYEKQRVVDSYVEENKEKLNELVGYYENFFKITKFNKHSYLIYQNNYLKSMNKIKMILIKNLFSVGVLSAGLCMINPYMMLLLTPEYLGLLSAFYFVSKVVDNIILSETKRTIILRTYNFLGFRKEYKVRYRIIANLFYVGQISNKVLNLNDKGWFFTTRLLRRFFYESKKDVSKQMQNGNNQELDNFKYFHKFGFGSKTYLLPADSSNQHEDTNEQLILHILNKNLKEILAYDYINYESKAEILKKKVEEYRREFAKKSYTPYASEEDLKRREYSNFHGNRDFSDYSYELTFKRTHGLDGTYVNNGYK